MYECVCDKDTDTTVVKVSGDMTVLNVADLYAKLNELAGCTGGVTVELSGLGDVDMTFFQLLCSAHRTFTAQDRQFCVTGDRAALFNNREYTGFIRHKGCSRDRFNNCVLVKEK